MTSSTHEWWNNHAPSKWDKRFLQMAKFYSTFSKDPSRKIGAVIVDDKKVVLSAGYNGFPRGILDSSERLNDREQKYRFVVHAEMNAIYNATFNGVSLDAAHLYVYGLPVCSECSKGIVQVGIKRVQCWIDEPIPDKWKESWKITQWILYEAGVPHLLVENELKE